VHRFVELNAHRGVLVIEQEEHLGGVRLAQADFHIFRHFEQRMQTAQLPHRQ
jgi:hypothetical protein